MFGMPLDPSRGGNAGRRARRRSKLSRVLCITTTRRSVQNRCNPFSRRSAFSKLGEHLVRDEGVAGSNPATPTNT
jgi:hypothetical protein